MGYAIVAYFDEETDRRVKQMWKGLADIGVDDYLINSANSPHYKMDMFTEFDLNYAKAELLDISKKYHKLDLHFKKFGFYPKKEMPFLTIDIAENLEVILLQKEIREEFSSHGSEAAQEYFKPGIWKPDIQLTRQFDKTKLAKAIEYLNNFDLPFDGKLERIGVIEFHPAKQLFAYTLK